MKPTEKFQKLVVNNNPTDQDIKTNIKTQKPTSTQHENRTVTISKIQALIRWAFDKSNPSEKIY